MTIVGGGIVGLATALALSARNPRLRLTVVEKEGEVGLHQTGHNSGVIHMGIYYRPGSLKAILCREGARRMMTFCESHGIPYDACGKVIVATSEGELDALRELHQRGTANGVHDLRLIGPPELKEIEPYAAGIAALHSPRTSIVDYGEVARAMADDLRAAGIDIQVGTRVITAHSSSDAITLQTSAGPLQSRVLVNCSGLFADVLARQMGVTPPAQIVPFRGEYYEVRKERDDLVRGLIYPVPDTRFPFLGVHFTRMIRGGIEAGPNAVLALRREGYTKSAFNAGELWDVLRYRGFQRLVRRYWRMGLYEMYRSLSPSAFVRSLQRLVPSIQAEDVHPAGAGVRAQAIARDGHLVDDFLITRSERAVHVLNTPSPAATASLAIGDFIALRALTSFPQH